MGNILIEQIEKGTAKTGNPFIKISCIFEDKTKHQVYLWDDIVRFEDLYNRGNLVYSCTFGGDANYPKVSSFEPVSMDVTAFYSFIYPSDEHAKKVVEALIHQITDPFYGELIRTVFSLTGPTGFNTVYDAFCVIPAAKAYHHDFRYGLVRHTHEVMSVVSRVADSDLYSSKVDKQTALCGAFLHDVGKCFEYSFNGVNSADYGETSKTNQIYLASHLYKGAELVAIAYEQMKQRDGSIATQVNDLKIEHIKHIILSHHLQREWGAVSKEPQTLEAFLVFIGDYFSAAFGKFDSIDWTEVSIDHLMGATSKYNTFFGFTPLIKKLEEEQE